jgi:hypothetical protein
MFSHSDGAVFLSLQSPEVAILGLPTLLTIPIEDSLKVRQLPNVPAVIIL